MVGIFVLFLSSMAVVLAVIWAGCCLNILGIYVTGHGYVGNETICLWDTLTDGKK